MNFKKTIISIGGCAVAATPFITIVSCGKSQTTYKEYDFKEIWDVTDGLKYEDVKLTHWIDGDTFTVEREMADGSKKTNNLRVSEIDTPESHIHDDDKGWIDTTGVEKIYADKATEFGNHEMPTNSTIRIVFQTGETYGRWVGSVFYGDHFNKSYSVNIVKAGLALPFLSTLTATDINSSWLPLHYIGVPIADAYNYARATKAGLWEHGTDMLKVHGATDLTAVTHNPVSGKSVYDYAEMDYWK